jgi:hypothetical protein
MSTEESDPTNSVVSMLMNPSRIMANWYAWLGMLGIFLAILNITGNIHPNYHLSWGGLFTLEATNDAFEPKSSSLQFVLSDFIFIGLCVAISGIGFRTINNDYSSMIHGRHWLILRLAVGTNCSELGLSCLELCFTSSTELCTAVGSILVSIQ